MARKKRTTRRRSRGGFNVRTALFSYLALNAGTQLAFNNSPYQFLASGYVSGVPGTSGSSRISLKEILSGQSAGYSQPSHDLMLNLRQNIQSNAPEFVMTLLGLAVGKRLLTASGIPRAFNRTTKQLGLGTLVRM
jgi:hypothetical protein